MKNNIEGFTNTKVINQEAAKWVLLLEETPKLSKQQVEELNAWINTSDVHRQCLKNMLQAWDEMDLLSSVMLPQEVNTRSGWSVTGAKLFFPFFALYVFSLALFKNNKRWLRPVFAMSVFTVVLSWSMFNILPSNQSANTVTLVTEQGESLSHLMPDGTVIWLNSSSELEVDFNDTARRVKLIKGEGHFQVAKMPSRPFEVYADDRLVKAIGTAFTVHKTRGNVEVLVTEGSVELALLDSTLVVMPDDYPATSIGQNIPSTAFKSAQSPEVKKVLGRLSAGQRASIQVDNDELTNVVDLDSSEVTRFLSWKEGKLVFAGESLEEVIREITRHTPIKIDVADPKLKSMRIGGQFKLGDTEALFYVLESGFGISVNKLDESHVELKVKEK